MVKGQKLTPGKSATRRLQVRGHTTTATANQDASPTTNQAVAVGPAVMVVVGSVLMVVVGPVFRVVVVGSRAGTQGWPSSYRRNSTPQFSPRRLNVKRTAVKK